MTASIERPAAPRVLFFSYHLPMPEEPGAFRPWMEARLLRDAGCHVTVLTSAVQYMTGQDLRDGKGWCTSEEREGIRILRTWAPADHRGSILRRVYNYLAYSLLSGWAGLFKVGRVEYVFAGTDPVFAMPVMYAVAALKRARLVLDERDLYPETAIALGMIPERGLIARVTLAMQRRFRRVSHHVVAATPGIRDALLADGHPESKVTLILNADAFFERDAPGGASEAAASVAIRSGYVVAYTGGLGRANDVWTLLGAVRRLRERHDLSFLIVGEGEYRPAYEEYCEREGLDTVHFTGAVPRARARQVLRNVDLCVQPLLSHPHFERTLTSKTFDYHASGRPIVFCGRGDTARLLEESGAGVVVPAEDDEALAQMILELIEDEPRRRVMGLAGRTWFEANVSRSALVSQLSRIFS